LSFYFSIFSFYLYFILPYLVLSFLPLFLFFLLCLFPSLLLDCKGTEEKVFANGYK
jgi:hypothetical protein